MMPFSTWLTFIIVALAATFSPGPGVLLAISTSVTLGLRRTLYSSAGNALGICIVSTIAVTGLGLLLQTSALAFGALKTVGAGYLIYLGVRQWRRTSEAPQQASPASTHSSTHVAAPVPAVTTRSGVFMRGMLVAVTNPKAILFFTAIFPQFMQTSRLDPTRFFLLTTSFVVCMLMSHLFYVLLAARLGNRMLGTARMRNINRANGLIFIGLGCAMFALARRPA